MAKLIKATVASVLVLLPFLAGQSVAGRYYSNKVQNEVRKEVDKAMDKNAKNPGIGAALVRLVFHDCWVNGCDGSVLLDSTPTDGTNTEKKADNNIGLGGFDVIDAIKRKVGPDVSCADIVAFAARDAADILSDGKIFYTIPGGRKDGVVSSAKAADDNLPKHSFDFGPLKDNFEARGFTVPELVALSGAHSVGVAHLQSFQDRLGGPDSTPIDSDYQKALNDTRPAVMPNNLRDASDNFREAAHYDPVAMGLGASPKRGVLDNSYYHNNLVLKVLFKSDWVLLTDPDGVAFNKVDEYKNNPDNWIKDFKAAMIKLSNLKPAEGSKLEIRQDCRYPNPQ